MLRNKAKLVQIHWQISPHVFLAKLIARLLLTTEFFPVFSVQYFPAWFNPNFSPKMTDQIKEFEVGMCSWMCGGGEAFLPSKQW